MKKSWKVAFLFYRESFKSSDRWMNKFTLWISMHKAKENLPVFRTSKSEKSRTNVRKREKLPQSKSNWDLHQKVFVGTSNEWNHSKLQPTICLRKHWNVHDKLLKPL
jgi:hypothetical protein